MTWEPFINCCEHGNECSGCLKCRQVTSLAQRSFAAQDGFCYSKPFNSISYSHYVALPSMKLIRNFIKFDTRNLKCSQSSLWIPSYAERMLPGTKALFSWRESAERILGLITGFPLKWTDTAFLLLQSYRVYLIKEHCGFNSRTKIGHDIQLNIELDSLDRDGKNLISFRYRCTELVLANKGYWCQRRISNVSCILFRLINLDTRAWNGLYVTTDRVVLM